MAEAETRPEAKIPEPTREPMIPPQPDDGRSPLERMTDLARRIVAVPKAELATARKRRHR
jgi:hypothetical protein